jgi:predicted CoA-binding protein
MDIKDILENTKIIAVVGCSTNPAKDAHNVPLFLQMQGYTIVPVNPNCSDVLGEKCYPDVQSIPDELNIDVVDIFRRPEATAGVIKDVIERFKKTKHKPIIWTQLGVSSDEAKRLAEEAGIEYVENRCMKIEYHRFLG